MKKSSDSLVQVVNLLNDGDYHDGPSLGDALDISRAAVWKVIKKLESYHVDIISIKGKGYALADELVLLDEAAIGQQLTNQTRDQVEYHVFESIDSTNNYFKSTLPAADKISVCIAEQMTQGRGRLNRPWHAPFGQNLYYSANFSFQMDMTQLAGLSLVVGLASLKTLSNYNLNKPVKVKWPNDLMCDAGKLGGILIEMTGESHGVTQAICGIGVNANMLNDDKDAITQSWTSLRQLVGEYIDRNLLAARLTEHLLDYIARFKQDGLAAFTDEWAQHDYLQGKDICVDNVGQQINGQVVGINPQGHLLLKLADGTVQAYSSGDTRILKKENRSKLI
jgi:BirA family transcriptional regulator, biotin operon repressor / biotin---[acetyl-CoA-carboxylase] ligase